ncbi:MAG: F0F1 ATP synthase subunit delta [Methylococcaceae bacterium]|jgi:F-type H+-transporting ATPase subunit delta
MSELATLARPYAAAVFKRAKETQATAKWSQSLAFMSAVLRNEDISVVVDNPKVNKQRLSALMLDICQGHVNEENENFLKLLVHNNRLSLLPTIAKLFEAYKAEDEGYVEVEVLTAYALSKEAKQDFTATLEKTLGKKIHMNVTVDKSLIGGFLVRAGDRVIDGSIRGRLQHMQKALQ